MNTTASDFDVLILSIATLGDGPDLTRLDFSKLHISQAPTSPYKMRPIFKTISRGEASC